MGSGCNHCYDIARFQKSACVIIYIVQYRFRVFELGDTHSFLYSYEMHFLLRLKRIEKPHSHELMNLRNVKAVGFCISSSTIKKKTARFSGVASQDFQDSKVDCVCP